MAPFCAHDCFHTHWRWSAISDQRFVHGWDKTGPYRVPGAPMVPYNQSVDVWFRAQNKMTYHATVGPDDGEGFIRSHTWQVIMHHGSGYALFFGAYVKKVLIEFAFDTLARPPYFVDMHDRIIESDSTAAFYWWCRYMADFGTMASTYVISERTLFADLKKARDL